MFILEQDYCSKSLELLKSAREYYKQEEVTMDSVIAANTLSNKAAKSLINLIVSKVGDKIYFGEPETFIEIDEITKQFLLDIRYSGIDIAVKKSPPSPARALVHKRVLHFIGVVALVYDMEIVEHLSKKNKIVTVLRDLESLESRLLKVRPGFQCIITDEENALLFELEKEPSHRILPVCDISTFEHI